MNYEIQYQTLLTNLHKLAALYRTKASNAKNDYSDDAYLQAECYDDCAERLEALLHAAPPPIPQPVDSPSPNSVPQSIS